jgi:signal transduction histidine kinase
MSLQNTLVSRNPRNASGGVRRTSRLDSELVALQEKLHRRVASELHDSTCQHLIAASLGMMQVKNALGDPRKLEEHCEQVDLSINHALKELRSLTYLLHPQSLFEGGLKTTIERYAEGYAIRTSLVVEVSISPAVDSLSRKKQRSLMRIVQEALTNVYRHAKATRVDITIEARERAFQLEIRDDGQGMMAGNGLNRFRPPALGTGLRIMHDRLDEMGGRLEILSAPTAVPRGTTLRGTFPYAFAIEHNGRRCALKKRC